MKWRKNRGTIFQYSTKNLDAQTLSVLCGCFVVGSSRFRNRLIKDIAHALIASLTCRVDGTIGPPIEVKFVHHTDADIDELKIACHHIAASLSSTPAAVSVLSAIGGAAGEEVQRRTGENSPVVDQLH